MSTHSQHGNQHASVKGESKSLFGAPPKSFFIQPKLTVNTPGDVYEQEADVMANHVMRMPDPAVSNQQPFFSTRRPSYNISPLSISRLQRTTPMEEEEKKEKLQRKESLQGEVAAGAHTESYLSSIQGSGAPLPSSAKSFFEPRFGYDFSDVRIHNDSRANESASNVNALAYTHGNNIVFGANQFSPESDKGKKLLAHELTHTIQQGTDARTKPGISRVAVPQIQRISLSEEIDPYFNRIPGFTLITYIIGKNPVTDEQVKRSVPGFFRAFFELIPGASDIFNKLNESGALQQAYNWLWTGIMELDITWEFIKGLFSRAWEEIKLWENTTEENLAIIVKIFKPTLTSLLTFGRKALSKIKEFVFRGFLQLAGAPVDQVMEILDRAGSVLSRIFDDPGTFIKNLLRSVVKGIEQFGENILAHLQKGITNWLFGTLESMKIEMPAKLDMAGFFSVVARVLGLTYQNFRSRIVKRLGENGEQIVSKIERTINFLDDFFTRGPIVLWEKVKDWLGDLKETVLNSVIEWVRNTIIVQGLIKLATMFNPAGAIIELIRGFYTTIMFLIDKAKQVAAFVESVFESITAIASGNIANAANAVENALSRALSTTINFLSRYINLEGIGKKIQAIIRLARMRVDKAIDRVVEWVIVQAQKVITTGKQAIQGVKNLLYPEKEFEVNGETHKISIEDRNVGAEVMIESEPKTSEEWIADYLQKHKTIEGDHPGNEKIAIFEEVKRIKSQIKQITEEHKNKTNKGLSELIEAELLKKSLLEREEELIQLIIKKLKPASPKGQEAMLDDKIQKVNLFFNTKDNRIGIIKNDPRYVRELLDVHGVWRDLIMYLESEPQNHLYVLAIEVLEQFRNQIVIYLKEKYGLYLSDPKGASVLASSDVDLATKDVYDDREVNRKFRGVGAGERMLNGEIYMKGEYGDNWSKLLRMNFYTEAERLFLYQKVQNQMGAAFGPYQRIVSGRAEELNFAKMLLHAGSNFESITRVEKLMSHLSPGEKSKVLDFARQAKSKNGKEMADRLHKEIDSLVAKSDALGPEKAMEITMKQMEANFYTEEAYIGPGAGRFAVRNVAVKGHEAYQSALSQLEMMEHVMHETKGNVEAAIREYELYKYIFRFTSAMALLKIPTSSLILQFHQAAYDIYKNTKERTSLQGVNKYDLSYLGAMYHAFIKEAAEALPKMKQIALSESNVWAKERDSFSKETAKTEIRETHKSPSIEDALMATVDNLDLADSLEYTSKNADEIYKKAVEMLEKRITEYPERDKF